MKQFEFGGEVLTIVEQQYAKGGTRLDVVDYRGAPYATLTKCVPGLALRDGEFVISPFNENSAIVAAAKHLFETVRSGPQGYYIWRYRSESCMEAAGRRTLAAALMTTGELEEQSARFEVLRKDPEHAEISEEYFQAMAAHLILSTRR